MTTKENSHKKFVNDIFKILLHSVAAFSILGAIFYVQYEKPVLYIQLIIEDSFGENATFVCYLLASLLLGLAMLANKSVRKPGYILLAFTLFTIGMEEISWGQRLLRIETPEVVANLSDQSEINVHNIIERKLNIETIFNYLVLIWISFFTLAFQLSSYVRSLALQWGVPRVSFTALPYFIISMLVYFLRPYINSVEVEEMLLSFAFVSFASDIFFQIRDSAQHSRRAYVIRTLLFNIIIIFMALFFGFVAQTRYYKFQLQFNGQMHEFASVFYPRKGLYHQAGQIFDYILRENNKMQNNQTLLQYGILLKRMNSPRAKSILQQALKQGLELQKKEPNNQHNNRNLGITQKLLNSKSGANIELKTVLDMDMARLAMAKNDSEKFWILLSMAKTHIAIENYDLALKELTEADDLTNSAKEKLAIKRWTARINKTKTITADDYLQFLNFLCTRIQ